MDDKIAFLSACVEALEAQARQHFELSRVPKWVYDPLTLGIVSVNRAAEALYGYTREEFLTRTLYDMRAEEDRGLIEQRVRSLDGSAPVSGPWRHLRRDGAAIWVRTASYDFEEAGRRLRMVVIVEETADSRAQAKVHQSESWLQSALEFGESAGYRGIATDVTERARLERKIQKRDEWLALAAECGRIGVWERDAATDLVRVSETVNQILGLPTGTLEVRMSELLALIHPEDCPLALEQRQAWLEGQGDLDFTHRIIARDGCTRWISVRGNAYRDSERRVVRSLGIMQDVTAHKQVELSLRDSEARFRTLTDLSSDWFWEQDEELRFTTVSPSYYSIMQHPPRGLGKRRWEIEHNLVPEDGWEQHKAALAAKLPFRDLKLERADGKGRRHTLSISGVPVFDERGRFRGYRGIGRDITDAVIAENALRRSEACFRLVTEGTSSVVWVTNQDVTAVHYVSPTISEVWGIPASQVRRDPRVIMTLLHPDDVPLALAALRRQVRGEPIELELRIVRPDGEHRWLVWRSNQKVIDGEHLVCAITEDVTARKRQQLRKLDDALRQRDTLVREVHHRIKNNLQGIAGLLRINSGAGDEHQIAMKRAITQVQAIATVHGLQGSYAAGGVTIHGVIEAIVRMLEELVNARIETKLTEVTTGARIEDDESVAVALILNELALNAAKHARSSGDRAHVCIEVSSVRGGLSVLIRNAGTLPPGFSISTRSGLGTGLKLVHALLPPKGVMLKIDSAYGEVSTKLEVFPPVLIRHERQRATQ